MSEAYQPTISVVMSVYNGEEFLAEAIHSILDQTYTDFEFIIVNDASTDNTETIIKGFADQRIVYIKNESNLELAASLNKAIKQAKGTYIARMDADDIAKPERLQVQHDYLETHTDIVLCGSNSILINDKGKNVGNVTPPHGFDSILGDMCIQNAVMHPTVMMRTSLFDKFAYNESFNRSQDYELWLRIVAKGYKMDNINQELLSYRIHEKSFSKKGREEQEHFVIEALGWFYKEMFGWDNVKHDISSLRKVKYYGRKLRNPFDTISLLRFSKKLLKAHRQTFDNQQAYEILRQHLYDMIYTTVPSVFRKKAISYISS